MLQLHLKFFDHLLVRAYPPMASDTSESVLCRAPTLWHAVLSKSPTRISHWTALSFRLLKSSFVQVASACLFLCNIFCAHFHVFLLSFFYATSIAFRLCCRRPCIGYTEWKIARRRMPSSCSPSEYTLPPPPEFQLSPVADRNRYTKESGGSYSPKLLAVRYPLYRKSHGFD